MKRNPSRNNRATWALVLVMLLAIMLPAAAVQTTIDLDQTYEIKKAHVSTIFATDLANLSLSKVEVLSTVGDDSDLQTIHTPVIRQVTRHFSAMSATYRDVALTITGENPSVLDYTGNPAFNIYTQRVVPTFRVTAPGHTGNPVLGRYNESWYLNSADMSSFFPFSSDSGYYYKTGGLLHFNRTDNQYYTAGTWSSADYDMDNLTFTFSHNKVALGSFATHRPSAVLMGEFWPWTTADAGKYYAGAFEHDEASQTLNVYAMSPVVALKAPTPLRWTNGSGPYTDAPFTWFSGAPEAVTLGFSGANPDLGSITNISYLIINDCARYDMALDIDAQKLAEAAEMRWHTSATPGTQVIDLLYDGMGHDAYTPYTYSLTAVGFPAQAPSTQYSAFAITPGFGISGSAKGTTITVPAANLSQLEPGRYDVYLLGTDAQNNVVALDQELVLVTTPEPVGDRIAIYKDGAWYIDRNGDGKWNACDQAYGFGDVLWTPIKGDWNGDGLSEIGVYKDGAWYLDADGTGWWSAGDKNFAFGAPGWTGIVGDWNADGTDKAGVYKDGAWYLDLNGNGAWDPGTDKNFAFGTAGWTPVAGKWNDGTTKIGIYKDGVYYIDYTGDYVYGPGDKAITYGTAGSIALTGDWNADGRTEVGTKTGKAWALDYDGLGAVNASTKQYSFGAATWGPVTGDWNDDGSDKIGIYLNGAWYLDYNGNGVWDAGTDRNYAFGTVNWIPVTGNWG